LLRQHSAKRFERVRVLGLLAVAPAEHAREAHRHARFVTLGMSMLRILADPLRTTFPLQVESEGEKKPTKGSISAETIIIISEFAFSEFCEL
jgi:hypothetical protein